MSLKTKKLNKETITVIPIKHPNANEILGYDIFPMLYCNVFICASKGSGKTNIINKILEKCIDKTCKVIVFASTHDIDENWKYIKEKLEKREISTIFYSALNENGIDNLEQLMAFMKQEAEATKTEEKEENINDYIQIVKVDYDISKYKLKIKKKKKKAPKYMIIFDDMSISLKKRNVPYLLKTFRHYKSKVIISTQYLNDLGPDSRMQIDYWLLFKGQSEDKIESIYSDIGTKLEFDEFYELYKTVTDPKYNFLYIDKNEAEFRQNFTDLIVKQ